MPSEIIGTGLSGLVGSRLVSLNPETKFTDISLDTGVNILDIDAVEKVISSSSADNVIHMAAFTDTTAAWEQRGDKQGLCYRLNVEGTQNVLSMCQKYNKHLIHISTDFVFDGKKVGSYSETDVPNPIEWYGMTKFLAEKLILESKYPSTIVRIAFPYRSNFSQKPDIVSKMISKFRNQQVLNLFSDQIITPTFVDDIVEGLMLVAGEKPLGIFHLVGSTALSPYFLAETVATIFGFDDKLINKTSLSDYAGNSNNRPYATNLSLSNEKFAKRFGIVPLYITEGLQELKQQLSLLP